MTTVVTRTSSAPVAPVTETAYPTGALALSPEAAAQAIDVTRTKIFALLASGAIRSVKIGKYRRIPVAEIEAFLRRELEKQSA